MADFFTTAAVVDEAAWIVKDSVDAHVQGEHNPVSHALIPALKDFRFVAVASVAGANKSTSTQGAGISSTNFSILGELRSQDRREEPSVSTITRDSKEACPMCRCCAPAVEVSSKQWIGALERTISALLVLRLERGFEAVIRGTKRQWYDFSIASALPSVQP
ncbi:hypothetical protein BDV93DRAFT_505740 [Ceratobasidium sp. AG-I]|nr:hypothetical protein BDV93DRAFT_505740 [Ceratobasidium sp. AG-I]